MAILIDTNVFIAAERLRREGALQSLLDQLPKDNREEEALISVITVSELLIGVERAIDDRIRARRSAFVEAILKQFNSLSIDVRVARRHSQLSAHLMASGNVIGTHDSWIAASALTYDFKVVTCNVSEFARVPDLRVVDTSN